MSKQILNEAKAEILIYDVIGGYFGEGVTDKAVKQALDALDGRDITVRINSPGGSVSIAYAIYNLLAAWPKDVTTVIDGLAASSASVIAMAGKTIRMAESSMLMIHDPWTVVLGDAAALRKEADVLDKFELQIATIYADRAGRTPEEFQKLMDAETWLTAEEAKNLGLIDEVAENRKAQNRYDLSQYKNAPKNWPAEPKTPRLDLARQRMAAVQL